MLVVILARWSLTVIIAQAQVKSPHSISSLDKDQLGESLNKFRGVHKGASCLARPITWSDERNFKRNWLLWVDCCLESGVAIVGQNLLRETNPSRPFGVFASFYKKRLAELSYMVSITSIEALLPILTRRYGEATRITYNSIGSVDCAFWANQKATVYVELVPIAAVTVDRNFLRIGVGPPSSAVRIRTRLNKMPQSDP